MRNSGPINTQNSLFRKIDEILFKQIDSLASGPGMQKFFAFFSSLKEPQQAIFRGLIIFILFAIPLVPTVFLFISNYKAHTLVTNLKIIQDTVDDYQFEKGQIDQNQELLATESLHNQDSLSALIDRARQMYQLQGTVSITSFDVQGTFVEEATSKLQLQGFSTDHLSQLIEFFVQKTKGKLKSMDLYRNEATGKIQGELEFTFMQKAES